MTADGKRTYAALAANVPCADKADIESALIELDVPLTLRGEVSQLSEKAAGISLTIRPMRNAVLNPKVSSPVMAENDPKTRTPGSSVMSP